jgi:hypothetical protein
MADDTKNTTTGAAQTEADANKIADGEFAVKLTRDIDGGLGDHKSGTVLRRLSQSAYNTLVNGGLGDPVKEGSSAKDAVDTSLTVG